MAAEEYVCLNIECGYRSMVQSPFCPICGHRGSLRPQSNVRWRRVIAGILSLAIACFVLLVAVFASFVVANQRGAATVKDASFLVLLYGIGAAFFIGGISLIIGGGRWFIRSLVSFGRHGGSGRI
jgi:hypothetical protein